MQYFAENVMFVSFACLLVRAAIFNANNIILFLQLWIYYHKFFG